MFTIKEFIEAVQELIKDGKADPNGVLQVVVYNKLTGYITAVGNGDNNKDIYIGVTESEV